MSDVLVFDGDCGFCTSTANYLTKKTKVPVRAEAWQLTDLGKYGLTQEMTAKRVYLVTENETYAGSKAMAYLFSKQTNFFISVVGKMLLLPPFSWLAVPGYALIAKYRHKLPGGTPACKL